MNELTSPLAASLRTVQPPRAAIGASNGVAIPDLSSDAELLAYSNHDPDAFRVLYDRYREPLDRYFRRRTRNADAALELSAETFARAWLMRDKFRDDHGGSLAPWLFGIGRNLLLMSIRQGEIDRRAATRLGVLERLDLPVADRAAAADWSDGADELLNSLPLSQREALRLRIVDDFDYDEVAAALGTTRSAARVRVHRGLSALRARLSNPSKENL